MEERDLASLAQLSARIGEDITLVQGAGGNTSIKLGRVLWVKASGTRLADALRTHIFVPVELDVVRSAIAAGSEQIALIANRTQTLLRPSIETSLHALLPQRVVVHVHSVNAIAWAVRVDAPVRLAERLDGLAWRWLPYCRPGLPLAQAVAASVGEGAPEVIMLGNHGLVVAANDCAGAAALLDEVEQRLALPARRVSAPRLDYLAELAADTVYAPAAYAECHFPALHPFHVRAATGGSLYPDHVVFLGPGARILHENEKPGTPDRAADSGLLPPPAFLVVPGAGTLARRDLGVDALSMLRCLGLVLARLSEEALLTYLARQDEHMLLNWDAEKYRMTRASVAVQAPLG